MSNQYTAFSGQDLLASGTDAQVAAAVRAAQRKKTAATILVFDDHSGRQIDLDLRKTREEVAAPRPAPQAPTQHDSPRAQGRPKLGVVAREVTLLPRHWEWLNQQSGGASGTLRRLVDLARKQDGEQQIVRDAQAAADRFMMAMLGNQPGYEEASRALYARDRSRFLALSRRWPADLRVYARRLAAPALANAVAANG